MQQRGVGMVQFRNVRPLGLRGQRLSCCFAGRLLYGEIITIQELLTDVLIGFRITAKTLHPRIQIQHSAAYSANIAPVDILAYA